MTTISNIMGNQQHQMNIITDIQSGISQFLVQVNLGQNTFKNGVPPSTSQQQSLGQNNAEQFPPIDRNDNMISSSKKPDRPQYSIWDSAQYKSKGNGIGLGNSK